MNQRSAVLLALIILLGLGTATTRAQPIPLFPSDPFLYFLQPSPPPQEPSEFYQWPMGFDNTFGFADTRLDQAWRLTNGHAYLGILDFGVATRHGSRSLTDLSNGIFPTSDFAGYAFRPEVDGEIIALGAFATAGNRIDLLLLDNPDAPPLATAWTEPGAGVHWRYTPIAPVAVQTATEYLVVLRTPITGYIVNQDQEPGFGLPWVVGDITILGGAVKGATTPLALQQNEIWTTDLKFRVSGSSAVHRPLLSSLDQRIVTPHPDLAANLKPHLSPSWGLSAGARSTDGGHGMHVTGIAAAHTNNALGGAGACPSCSIVSANKAGVSAEVEGELISALTASGVQVINLSNGDPFIPAFEPIRQAIQTSANTYDVVIVASAGNDRRSSADFPADLPEVIGVAGTDPLGNRWDDSGHCIVDSECGTNFGPGVSLAAPAKSVLSAWLPGHDTDLVNGVPLCGDSLHGDPADGFGLCTGTSMSAPFVSGVAGLLRSINPLMSRHDVQTALEQTAQDIGDPALGAGLLDAEQAIARALGTSGGTLIRNRLAPLFSLWSPAAEDFLYTSVPQMAVAAIRDNGRRTFSNPDDPTSIGPPAPYVSNAFDPPVPGYSTFPGGLGQTPRAGVWVFTTAWNPLATPPAAQRSLIPLYRMSFVAPSAANPADRDHVLITLEAGPQDLGTFRQAGYELDGLEGFIFPAGEPQPVGTVKLYRALNAARWDFAVFPESQLALMQSQGYNGPTLLGFAYPADSDTDEDGLIDGFETLLGTDPNQADSDCDGFDDGAELPLTGLPVSDPLDATCDLDLADLAISLTTSAASSAKGSLWSVDAAVSNLGPGNATDVELEITFESSDWAWGLTGTAWGCIDLGPPDGVIVLGTLVRYRCPMGGLIDDTSTSLSFMVAPSLNPSVLEITATVKATTADPQPANNEAAATVAGGL